LTPRRNGILYLLRDEIHAVLHREGDVICVLAFLALVGFQKIVVNEMISGLVSRVVRLLSDKRSIGYQLPPTTTI
jgi:hypothetical protein